MLISYIGTYEIIKSIIFHIVLISSLCIKTKSNTNGNIKLIQMYKIPKKHCLMGRILVLPNQNLVVSLSEGITKIYG